MKVLLQSIADMAKELLLEDGSIDPIFMWFKNKEIIIQPQSFCNFQECNEYESKTRNVFAAGSFARLLKADLVVIVWDAAFREMPVDTMMDATETPLTYPRSMRTESIIVTGIPIPDGEDDIIMIPYKGGAGEPIEFIPNTFQGSKFKSRFTPLVRQGWNTVGTII
jgi:hypothetical protein